MNCEQCGVSFEPKSNGSTRFCSRSCSNRDRRRDAGERFWPKVDKNGPPPVHRPELGPCWLWRGAESEGGYGLFWVNETHRSVRAHRLAYELLVGPIPEGLTLDHLCRVPGCVNPAHLDPCTAGENAARSPNAPYNVKARQTHCKRGHPFDDANTAVYAGRRACRICHLGAQRARLARQRSEDEAASA